MNNQELKHYGVPGMKWGERKIRKYNEKARNAKSPEQAEEYRQEAYSIKSRMKEVESVAKKAERAGNMKDANRIRELNNKNPMWYKQAGVGAAVGALVGIGSIAVTEVLKRTKYKEAVAAVSDKPSARMLTLLNDVTTGALIGGAVGSMREKQNNKTFEKYKYRKY